MGCDVGVEAKLKYFPPQVVLVTEGVFIQVPETLPKRVVIFAMADAGPCFD